MHRENNRGQGVLRGRKLEEAKWCRCSKQKKRKEVVVCFREEKVQQDSTQIEVPKNTVKEEDRQRDIRRTFKMLREIWLNIEVEKVNMHEGIIVKALLDSGATGMFMNKKMAAKHRFRLQKLERPMTVKNVDGTNNSGGAITYQVKVNVYYKSHVERMRMDVCDLGKTEVILGVTNFIWTITPGILDRFRRSKWPPKALKKTFLTVPKTSQSDQYSSRYQQISL